MKVGSDRLEERDWLYAMIKMNGLGRKKLWELYGRWGSFAQAAVNWKTVLEEGNVRVRTVQTWTDALAPSAVLAVKQERIRAGISFVCFWEEAFPPLLRNIPDPPLALFYRGDVSLLKQPAIGVVGARKPTAYGRAACRHLVKQLAQTGMVIVSGLAYGIDAEAHRAALDAGAPTVGVMGCGIDQVYPVFHRRLYAEIGSSGLLLSEYPPGTPAKPGLFPERNRIISGLSLGVLVVEAAERSGSLITADCALEQGREVFAVPGPIFSEVSAGPHNLLKQGAKLVTNAADVLDELGVWPKTPVADDQPACGDGGRLGEAESKVYALIGCEPVHADQLAEALPPRERQRLHQTLLMLETGGFIVSLPGGYFARK
ncbi:DNA processing protein [Brevibacillus aydinogluensis]|uniref:DNA-processing protein DprA n=1 Tax=Brevibacillus aydinogluensis TaxID=927786 RepID=UPI0026CDA181|nr:DNA-processing protein DprA [Brevibacillus aydinogluensis]MDT3415037.1 DNA processing protein [Brevibacillus aydinogluensis]